MSPGVQPSMDTSHGRTRTPRMAHTIKPGEGVGGSQLCSRVMAEFLVSGCLCCRGIYHIYIYINSNIFYMYSVYIYILFFPA